MYAQPVQPGGGYPSQAQVSNPTSYFVSRVPFRPPSYLLIIFIITEQPLNPGGYAPSAAPYPGSPGAPAPYAAPYAAPYGAPPAGITANYDSRLPPDVVYALCCCQLKQPD